jgi:hypothetical protein
VAKINTKNFQGSGQRNGRVDSTRVSQLKLQEKATEPAQNPLMQIMIEE